MNDMQLHAIQVSSSLLTSSAVSHNPKKSYFSPITQEITDI